MTALPAYVNQESCAQVSERKADRDSVEKCVYGGREKKEEIAQKFTEKGKTMEWRRWRGGNQTRTARDTCP